MKKSAILIAFIWSISLPKQSSAGIWPFDDGAIDYEIAFEGVLPETAKKLELEKIARQAVDAEQPPQDESELYALSVAMAERVRKLMESHGFYDAVVRSALDEDSDDLTIIFTISKGTKYLVSDSHIVWKDIPLEVDNETQYKMKKGDPVKARIVLENADKLTDVLSKDKCFLSFDLKPRLVLDKLFHEAEVEYRIDYGAKANFGDVKIEGNSTVSPDIIKKSIVWKQGDCYSENKTDATQTKLLQSQLFSNVDISHADEANEAGEVPITLTVKDRPHRTVTAGANYAFDEGFGVTGGWEGT